jgi:hypothetical protein
MARVTNGRRAKTDLNAREESQGDLLTGFSGNTQKSLESKLASLEARVEELEARVDRLEGIAPSYYYDRETDNRKKKSGPDKNIEDVELYRHRDGLVGWLEDVWPEVVKPLLATSDPREIAVLFQKVARRLGNEDRQNLADC